MSQPLEKVRLLGEALRICGNLFGLLLVRILLVVVELLVFLKVVSR